jgi:hypothetical protein
MHRLRLVSVPFEWLTQEGDELQFLAALHWRDDEAAPRVQVFYLRSGEFVCQSLMGDLYRIDPAHLAVDATLSVDEIEHGLWRNRQAKPDGKAV